MSAVTLYAASVAALSDPERYAEACRLVSAARRERLNRLSRQPDRCRSLAAELLLRRALKDCGLQPPFAFRLSPAGKPYLPDAPRFSLSHSGVHVLCAVSEREVGCDVERIRPVSPKLAERFFCPEEAAEIAAAPTEEARLRSFFRFWTLKESYVKALGTGMRLPFRSFRLRLEPAPALVSPQDAGRFAFREFTALPGYCCALAVEGDSSAVEWIAVPPEQLL